MSTPQASEAPPDFASNYEQLSSNSATLKRPAQFCLQSALSKLCISTCRRSPNRPMFIATRSVVRQPPRAVQRFLREALKVIKAGTDLSGDLNKALFWYRNEPLSAFGYKTAEQLVSDGRTDDGLGYVGSLEAGAAG